MNALIWQAATGGFLQAARVLELRCPVIMPGGLLLSPEVGHCLDAAASLAAHGRTPGDGLQALASAFGHLYGKALTTSIGSPWEAMRGEWMAACPNCAFPVHLDCEALEKAASALCKKLEKALALQDYAMLERACETVLAFLPLLPGDREDGDISLYEYGRLTSALASCYVQLIQEDETADCGKLQKKNCLLLFSCDFSGIQNFIYLISTKSALKMLRSRSFYLEWMLEHLIDELLDACGLAHCNCLYAGGGHAYVLLPNTAQVQAVVHHFSDAVNAWLREQFGMSLYLACGTQPCAPAALFGQAGQQDYSDVFRSLSAQLGHAKLTRCDADALRVLNRSMQEARECKICGRPAADGELCDWCDRFSRLGGRLTEPHQLFAMTDRPLGLSSLCLPMPGMNGNRFACLLSMEQAKAAANDPSVLRWYSKNEAIDVLPNCRCLWMGDHCPTPLLEELNQQSEGISRMGVFRADVDNLGKAFISGFVSPDGTQNRVSLARTMAFSRNLSVFFKRSINQILAPFDGVLVVYSGGDDLFFVGGWSDLLQAAVQLRRAFAQYTDHALTFSAGFGLYTIRYPIARAAVETANLEDFAKELPTKNAITLFAEEDNFRFDWPTFEVKVMDEKYRLLETFFQADANERGNAFLYRLLAYLRAAEDRLNLARCAYLLARLRPKKGTPQQAQAYETFSRGFYSWAFKSEDRRQLIAAIYLYIYLHRGQGAEEGGTLQ